MNTYFIGKIVGVKPLNRTDKTTGQSTVLTNVTLMFETIDAEGYDTIASTDIQLDVTELSKLTPLKGKYMAFPYRFIQTPKGNFLFADETLQYKIFKDNPLNNNISLDQASKAS